MAGQEKGKAMGIKVSGLAAFPPEFRNHYDCPDCGEKWTISARVIRDDECPRCGSVSLPVSYQESE